MLYNSISSEEYENISCYETAKEMQDKLEVTYEGTKKVMQTLVSFLVYEYELFKMKDGESTEEIFARFGQIIVELKVVGKTYPISDQTTRILRSLLFRGF